MATNTDLLSLLNLCPEVTGELAALLAAQSQPLVTEPLADPALLEQGMAAFLGEPAGNQFGGPGAGGWGGLGEAAAKNMLLQEMAQSLAATMEQQRKQQQLATALQLRALQQQQELAALQQLNSLNAATAGPGQRHLAAFSRAISNDLEYRSQPSGVHHPPSGHPGYQRAASVDLEGMGSPLAAHLGLTGHPHHLAGPPARSFSSEHLEPRRHPLQRGTPLHMAQGNAPPVRGPPQSRPSFNNRNPNGARGHRGHGGGNAGGQRHGATAKAPCWAGSDWHPLKAVLSSASHAAAPSGTGVFLPHLADQPASDSKAGSSHAGSDHSKAPSSAVSTGSGEDGHRSAESLVAAVGGVSGQLDTSPACSLDGVSTCSDPWSRSSTLDMETSAVSGVTAHHHHSVMAMCGGAPGSVGAMQHAPSPLSARPLACHPEASREGFDDGDDFGPLAKELAELMSRQAVMFE